MSAVKGLVDVLRRIELGDVNVQMEWSRESEQREADALRAIARAALSTWEARGRLRDDRALVVAITDAAMKTVPGFTVYDARDILDIIDTAVLGTPK